MELVVFSIDFGAEIGLGLGGSLISWLTLTDFISLMDSTVLLFEV